jgi:sugar phosphate isomerase/epimerase
MSPSPHPIGVPSQLFRGAPADVAAACRRHDLTCVQLTPSFPGLPFQEPAHFAPARCRSVAEPFLTAGLSVACVAAHVNLMEPHLSRRRRGIQRLHALLRQARDFGTRHVLTESGSLSSDSPGRPYAPNRSAAARAELRLIVALAVEVAADHGVTLLLKADPAHVVASAEDVLRLADRVNSPHLGFVMDPAAFLMGHPPEEWAGAMGRLFEQVGPLAPVAVAKDLRRDEDGVTLPRAGLGAFDYRQFLRLLDRYQPAAPIILEHLRPDEVEAARAYVEGFTDPL